MKKVNIELERTIINWLFDNYNLFNRLNACVDNFREYVYNKHGDYLIGGEDVYNFIKEMDKLI